MSRNKYLNYNIKTYNTNDCSKTYISIYIFIEIPGK